MVSFKYSNLIDTLTGYLLDTDGCPSPRVGHASLTLGNAFIVFGGDTKIEEADELDDNLYLLNTTSLKWTVANPLGQRPSGRYGHTVSTIGSVLYVFGGQLDDYFFDDLVCYDLTTLQSSSSQWNFIQPNSRSPPPRTNHTTITYQDKLYLFGGTDGKLWYSDTWVYDPAENTWTALECAGFIPAPCEGHSATIVGDIMYVFGGRSAEGKDLGTLSALKIPARKWFSFQNMGPGPTPRSGHSMTAFGGHKILIMGGESPDLDPQNPDGYSNDYESTNLVYVLDTARISYPATADQPPISAKRPEEQRQLNPPPATNSTTPSPDPSTLGGSVPASVPVSVPVSVPESTPASVPGSAPAPVRVPAPAQAPAHTSIPESTSRDIAPVVQKTKEETRPKADRSESVVSELTPGYGYERIDVGSPDGKDGTRSSTSDYEEAVTPKNEMSREFRDAQSDKTNTPASTIHPDSSPKDVSPRDLNTRDYDHRSESVSNVNQALESLKASNSWYETELASAREKGFIPATRPPVDVMLLRRTSQHITRDTDDSLSERAILVEALTSLKEELNEVQDNVKTQAEQASAKIAEAEADRDDAFERVKLLEAQLLAAQGSGGHLALSRSGESRAVSGGAPLDGEETIDSLKAQLEELRKQHSLYSEGDPTLELEKLRSDNINLEQQLRTFSDKSILAQHEAARYKTQLDELQSRHKVLEDTTDDNVKALAAASLALAASQAKSTDFQGLLSNRDNDKAALQAKVNSLTAELETTRQELAEANADLGNHKTMLAKAAEQDASSSAALTSGIDRIVAMWAMSKAFGGRRSSQRGLEEGNAAEGEEKEEEEEEDPEVTTLKKELAEVTGLYETHQKVSSDATRELATSLQQISFLKQELAASEKTRAQLDEQLETFKSEITAVRGELESSQMQLNDHKQSLDTFTQNAKQRTTDHEDAVEDLKKQLEDFEARYAALETEYDGSLQYVRNADKALHKTRDELSKYKDTSAKLQTEIDDLRLRLQDQEDNEDNESVTSSGGVRSRNDHRVGTPPARYNSRQIDLQLRDLRAQIIILQEERDELRASTLELKKKLIAHVEDLKDAQAMIESLEQENDALTKRVHLAEDAAITSRASNGGTPMMSAGDSRASLGSAHAYMDSPVDPEHADRTLDDFTSELDQIRNQRERISGILKS